MLSTGFPRGDPPLRRLAIVRPRSSGRAQPALPFGLTPYTWKAKVGYYQWCWEHNHQSSIPLSATPSQACLLDWVVFPLHIFIALASLSHIRSHYTQQSLPISFVLSVYVQRTVLEQEKPRGNLKRRQNFREGMK
ncbi:hypothetical protein Ddc_16322 [Ditylenchus destructor]|nr:hypothetical protein Ddc_16322 [Ditylenchus destructor]